MYNFKGWLTKNKLSSVAWAEVAYFPLMSLCPNASVNKLSFRICHMYTCLFGFLSPLFLFLFFFSSLLPFFLITHILSWLLCIFVNTAFLFFFFFMPLQHQTEEKHFKTQYSGLAGHYSSPSPWEVRAQEQMSHFAEEHMLQLRALLMWVSWERPAVRNCCTGDSDLGWSEIACEFFMKSDVRRKSQTVPSCQMGTAKSKQQQNH